MAGIWDRWNDGTTGEIVVSFSMLTINEEGHPIMRRFHRPGDERRSLVVVLPSKWTDWLSATLDTVRAMLTKMPVTEFTSESVMGWSSAPAQVSFL